MKSPVIAANQSLAAPINAVPTASEIVNMSRNRSTVN
jgi:hypothetical protein